MTNHMQPSEVIPSLKHSILTDGFDLVMDFEKSQGARLFDAKNNREYIDFFSFFASNPIGFNHPRMKEPDFQKNLLQTAKVKISNSDVYTTQLAEFVDYFHKNFCPMFDKLFFIDGGALAVENAIKAAQDWKVQKNLKAGRPEKGTQVLHFKNAFHGRTGYTLSLTNTLEDKTKYFAKFDWPRVTNPKLSFPLTDESLAKTIELEKKAVSEIKNAFSSRPDEICSILIETIQGEGGDNFFRKEFLQQLKALSLENDALLIFDEVQTGLGFTGTRWAFENFDVQPDMIAFGKKVQVCGVAAKCDRLNEVDHVFKTSSRINSTWGGNLVDMVRSTQFMKIIIEEKLMENAKNLGSKILSQLVGLAEETKKISNVRGLGLWMAFDFPNGKERDSALKAFWENNLMILSCGDRSIRLRPVLNLTEEEAQSGMNIIEKTLKSL